MLASTPSIRCYTGSVDYTRTSCVAHRSANSMVLHMTRYSYGLERRLLTTSGMLRDMHARLQHNRRRMEILEERLVEANTALVAAQAAAHNAEAAAEEAINNTNDQAQAAIEANNTMAEVAVHAAQEQAQHAIEAHATAAAQRERDRVIARRRRNYYLEHRRRSTARSAPVPRRRRLTLRAIVSPPLALPAPPTPLAVQPPTVEDSQEEEIEPEEVIPATPETPEPRFELHFVSAMDYPYP
ncbi:hypothetical protein BRADI_4g14787v3 [Brachypodium distachyon]|uniref:Uncharacterized protein n=1 Tax=Brachypodium distachyon TaxID=15368 RepID=A0A2K2CMW6_BRADI|nr:hypothetical protein BRADI_4g14787v3 [Brachypodium distachyon]